MNVRTRTVGLVVTAMTLMAFLYSLLLLQSVKVAVATYVLGLGLTAVFFEPFLGLANYLVFLYLRPQEFAGGFVGMPVMLVLGSATFAMMLLHSAFTSRSLALKGAPQNILMILFLAAIVLSHLAHLYLHGAVSSGRSFLSTLVMYLLIANLVTTEAKLKATLHIMALLTLVLAVQGIYQHFTGVGLAGQTPIEGRIRGIGIFADPNDLALTFLVVLPFLFFCAKEGRGWFVRLYALAAMAVLLYAIYLTNSRGGFLGLAILFVLMLIRSYGVLPGLAGGLVLVAVMFALGPSRLSEINPEEASAYGRIEAWGAGMEMLKTSPLFGVGAGNFLEYHFRTAHNSYVLCAAELGLFGLYLWLLLILVSMRVCRFAALEATARGDREVRLLSDSVFYGFVGFLSAAFFLSRTYNELIYILIGLSVSCSSVLAAATGERYQLMERKDLALALALTAVVLMLWKVLLVLYL